MTEIVSLPLASLPDDQLVGLARDAMRHGRSASAMVAEITGRNAALIARCQQLRAERALRPSR